MTPTPKSMIEQGDGALPPSDQAAPSAICGYPLPGWRLDKVEWSEIQGQPDGWIVSLKREGRDWSRRHSYIAMARSDIGPLEAWDAALQIAMRDDCRWALRDKSSQPLDTPSILNEGAAK